LDSLATFIKNNAMPEQTHKKDITTQEDIKLLVDSFYEKATKDALIGHFFTQIENFEEHLPVMYQFWSKIVFQAEGYTGNPIPKHLEIHQNSPINAQDFERWLNLFTETTDELFEGIQAEMIKQRAASIAVVIQTKIHQQSILK